jgi:hypothetical protein
VTTFYEFIRVDFYCRYNIICNENAKIISSQKLRKLLVQMSAFSDKRHAMRGRGGIKKTWQASFIMLAMFVL